MSRAGFRATLSAMSRRTIYTLVLSGAVLVAGAIILTAVLVSRDSSPTVTTEAAPENVGVQVDGVADTVALLEGIPQNGTTLGNPKAPVTLVEYADLQCPYCARFSNEQFPAIVRDYVRTGKVKVIFRGLTFVGPDSEKALDTALAAGQQERLWHVVKLLYANQGGENEGWVSDGLLRSVGQAVPGLSVHSMLEARSDPAIAEERTNAQAHATMAGVTGTPTFAVGSTGGALELVGSSEEQDLRAALDAALAGSR
jgi:protein-disulfide isomerase